MKTTTYALVCLTTLTAILAATPASAGPTCEGPNGEVTAQACTDLDQPGYACVGGVAGTLNQGGHAFLCADIQSGYGVGFNAGITGGRSFDLVAWTDTYCILVTVSSTVIHQCPL